MRSALKNRVHALMAWQGVQRAHADLFGEGALRFLDDLSLRPDPRARLEVLLRFDRRLRPHGNRGTRGCR
jgi:hypothetical protein